MAAAHRFTGGTPIEIIALTILRKLSKRGMRPFDLLASLLAGIGLMLALRGALTGSTRWVQ